MKQHITTEQVFELETFDSLGFENWDKICELNTIADIQFYIDCQTFRECCCETAKQMTIGKMIEILINLDYIPLIDTSASSCDVTIFENGHHEVFMSPELCDSLYEAVKYTLKA